MNLSGTNPGEGQLVLAIISLCSFHVSNVHSSTQPFLFVLRSSNGGSLVKGNTSNNCRRCVHHFKLCYLRKGRTPGHTEELVKVAIFF